MGRASDFTQREVESNPNIPDPNSMIEGPGFVAPIGVGGVWLAFFLWHLTQRPLIPRNDPDFVNAMAHERP